MTTIISMDVQYKTLRIDCVVNQNWYPNLYYAILILTLRQLDALLAIEALHLFKPISGN